MQQALQDKVRAAKLTVPAVGIPLQSAETEILSKAK